jgi:hypothetical protein
MNKNKVGYVSKIRALSTRSFDGRNKLGKEKG